MKDLDWFEHASQWFKENGIIRYGKERLTPRREKTTNC